MMSLLVDQIRFYHYISAVLANQQADPLCGACRAFSNTLAALREELAELEHEHSDKSCCLPGETTHLLEEARSRIFSIKISGDATGQKKAGNCKMPEGVCFIKTSKAILNKIQNPSSGHPDKPEVKNRE
jgi:hypothetical protein